MKGMKVEMKKNNLKKIFTALLAMSLVTTSISGCGKKDDESNKDDKTNTLAGTDDEGLHPLLDSEEPVKISMLYNTSTPVDDWKLQEYVREAINVELDIIPVPSSDYNTKVASVFISDEIPDLIGQYTATLGDIASDVLLPISDYEDMMPNYKAFLEESGMREGIDNSRVADGKYYTLPIKSVDETVQIKQWSIRTDIFEKHNLPIPTTLEEVYEVGLELLELYPDSVPITNRFGSGHIMGGISRGFGTIAGWQIADTLLYDEESDEWIFAPGTEEFKAMLEYTNKLYTSGVLDQEFSTSDSPTYEENVIKGNTFIMYDWASNNINFNVEGQKVNPEFMVSPINPVTGPNGDYALEATNQWTQGMVLPASLADDEEHLAEVLAFLDWGYTEEAEMLLTWGKEGESFKYDENGVPQWLDPNISYFETWGLDSNNICFRENIDAILGGFEPEEKEVFTYVTENNAIPPMIPTSPLDSDQVEQVQVYLQGIKDHVNAEMESFIFGNRPISEFDDFVKECEELKSNDLVEIYNEAWKSK